MTKEKIKNFYNKNTDVVNIVLIFLLLTVGFLIFHGNYNGLLTDKGREMLFPKAILDGKILYKDILCIYFPLSFQLNAIFYKLFGVNLSVLLFWGLINTGITFSLIYLIAKEFISKNLSLLFVITFSMASAFNGTLFNSILPYSTSFTYGVSAYLTGLFLTIKYLKTSNSKYINLAYLAGGYALSCKSEFALLFIILFCTSFLIKRDNIKVNFLNLCLYCVIPAISFGSLFIQGLTIQEFTNALDFMRKFFTSDAMIYHITRTGALPSIDSSFMYIESLIKLTIFYGLSFCLFKISKKFKIFSAFALALSAITANFTNIGTNTVLLPLFMTIFLIANIKDIYKNQCLFVLIIAALFLNIRMFWALQLNIYGMLTAHILVLALIIILFQYFKGMKYFSKDELKKFISYILIVYCLFFTAFNFIKKSSNNTPLTTVNGKIYLPKAKAEAVDYAIKYIQQYSSPDKKILVLPEGMAINFLSERDLDYKMPMLDRLYYEAFSIDEIIKNLENADYEMIFIVKGYGLTNFGKPYLYDDNNPVMQYIKSKYINDWKTEYFDGKSNNIMYCYVKPY